MNNSSPSFVFIKGVPCLATDANWKVVKPHRGSHLSNLIIGYFIKQGAICMSTFVVQADLYL